MRGSVPAAPELLAVLDRAVRGEGPAVCTLERAVIRIEGAGPARQAK